MQQLKQILMMLALLMTAATGAWATDVYVAGNGGDVSGGKWCNGQTWIADAAANKMTEQNGIYSITFTGLPAYSGYEFKFALNGTWSTSYGYSSTTVIELNKTLSVIEASGENTNAKFSLTETADVTISFNLSELTFMISTSGMKAGDDAAPSTTVNLTRGTGDKANEWTFDDGMPAGNVTVNVEYYDYAELTAADAIAANNAARAQTDDLLATVAENPATGGTLMYYLTTDATFTQAQALALAETDWSSTVPTAKDIDAAGATVYLWYYIKGDAEHSDTDPVQLTVTVQPEPTYNVEFAAGTNPDAPADPVWTATPSTGVKKGDKVTVTYTGTRKALGVRAEKKPELTE